MSIEIVVVLFSRGGGYKLQNGLSPSEDLMYVIFIINHLLRKKILWYQNLMNVFIKSFWSHFPSKQLNNMVPFLSTLCDATYPNSFCPIYLWTVQEPSCKCLVWVWVLLHYLWKDTCKIWAVVFVRRSKETNSAILCYYKSR